MALKDILTNGSKYADDVVLTLPDGTTATVGEMRSLESDEKKALINRQNTLSQAEMAFAGRFQEAIKTGWLSSDGKIVPPQNMTDKQVRQAAAAEFGVDESDPLLGSVVKEFRAELAKRDSALEAMKTEMLGAVGSVTNVVKTTVGRYLDQNYRAEFADATKALPKGVKVDYEAAYKYASDHGMKDKDGVLQIASAVDRLTWEDVKKAQRAEIEQQVTADLENRNRIATVTRPRTAGPENHRTKTDFDPFNERADAHGNKTKVAKSFDEAIAEAQNDTDLLESALRTASFGVTQ